MGYSHAQRARLDAQADALATLLKVDPEAVMIGSNHLYLSPDQAEVLLMLAPLLEAVAVIAPGVADGDHPADVALRDAYYAFIEKRGPH